MCHTHQKRAMWSPGEIFHPDTLTVKPTVEAWLGTLLISSTLLHNHFVRLYLLITMEENYIPLETKSYANTPVTPSEPEGSKGKGKEHSEFLITAKNWTPIATQRNRKPQKLASIQGKPTLSTCGGKITIINPVLTTKGKFPKAVDNKFLQGTLKDLGFQRHQPEDIEGFPRTRRPGRGHLEHSGGWQDIEGNHTHPAIYIPIQQEPQTRGLEGYGPSSSAPPTPQRDFSMEHGQQEVQPGFPLGRTWRKLTEYLYQRDRLQRTYGNHQRLESYQAVQTPGGEGKQDKGESSHYPSYRRTTYPDRAYSDSFRLARSRPNQLSSGFTPFRNKQISGQESPLFTIPGSFQDKTKTQGRKQNLFQPKAERVRANDPEAIGFGEISAQEPGVAANNSRISIPINRNITPTQIEHNVVTSERNLNIDSLWLQMSQFAEKTQRQFS
ncbi:hypothetical protein O181_031157 [Austropuccinia psidii MF-1]|uniref:Uncharacterized protein n=1 Tax=Austropuccinia psidii MF-1 TaxID=1389203 RepID=A0A9Q3H533_9BASI|nr:hypothetical protein [Austropuccinia psidii MF-1]